MITIKCPGCNRSFNIEETLLNLGLSCCFCRRRLRELENIPVQVEDYILEGIQFADKNKKLAYLDMSNVIYVCMYLINNGFKRSASWIDSHRDLYLKGLRNGFTVIPS